eukprot:Skav212838  [mRNA]  locus=scaffold2466:236782:244559:- [translate_table: standard]
MVQRCSLSSDIGGPAVLRARTLPFEAQSKLTGSSGAQAVSVSGVASATGAEEPPDEVPSTSPKDTLRTRSNSRASVQNAMGGSGGLGSGGLGSLPQRTVMKSGRKPAEAFLGQQRRRLRFSTGLRAQLVAAAAGARGIDLSAFESQLRQLEERCEDAEMKLATCLAAQWRASIASSLIAA